MPRHACSMWLPLCSLLLLAPVAQAAEPLALSFGSGGCGRLEGGTEVPCEGPNYEAFATTACRLGRTWLHPLVAATITDAYSDLATMLPARRWQYGELGLKEGGRLRPHKTHQNGRSADFFVPVIDAKGASALVPIRVHQKFGYGLEFDRRGRLGDGLRIDWKALAAHLLALDAAGKRHGVRIERVILTPAFHKALFAAAPELKSMAPRFMKKEAWVRHDEHYHVDFSIPARLTRPLSCRK